MDLTSEEIDELLGDPTEEISLVPRTSMTPLRKKTFQSQIVFGRGSEGATHTTLEHTLAPLTRRPTIHINTTYKIKNWSLAGREKWLILGDSNVARFPPFKVTDLQIDSFPGASFRHVQGVLSKMDPVPTVETLILSLGLNSTTQTSIKDLQRHIRMAKVKFPQAEIWLPLINFL